MPSPPTSTGPSRSGTPMAEPDLFASLTLSSQPVVSPPANKTVFGVPSLPGPSSANPPSPSRTQRPPARTVSVVMADADDDEEKDPDAMDWSPTKPVPVQEDMDSGKDQVWLRPQRFFAPEEPTGLENLFAKTIRLVDADDSSGQNRVTDEKARGAQSLKPHTSKVAWTRVLFFLVPLIPIVGMAYRIWIRRTAQAINGYT